MHFPHPALTTVWVLPGFHTHPSLWVKRQTGEEAQWLNRQGSQRTVSLPSDFKWQWKIRGRQTVQMPTCHVLEKRELLNIQHAFHFLLTTRSQRKSNFIQNVNYWEKASCTSLFPSSYCIFPFSFISLLLKITSRFYLLFSFNHFNPTWSHLLLD